MGYALSTDSLVVGSEIFEAVGVWIDYAFINQRRLLPSA